MFNCEQCRRWMSACEDGELNPARRSELHRHLSGCASCRERYETGLQLHQALSSAFSAPLKQEADVSGRVMAALSREPYRPVPRRSWLRQPLAFLSPIPARYAAGLAGAALLALGWGLNPFSDRPTPSPDVRQVAEVSPPVRLLHRTVPPQSLPSRASVQPSEPGPKVQAKSEEAKPVSTMSLKPVKGSTTRVEAKIAFKKVVVSKRNYSLKSTSKSASYLHSGTPAFKAKLPLQIPLGSQPRKTDSPTLLACVVRLQHVAGTVETRNEASPEWSYASADASVKVDQRVRSGQDSLVAMTLDGGIELRMNQKTEVVPVRSPQPDAPYWVVQLVSGEIFVRIPKGKYGLKVLTPAGDALSSEGEFVLQSNEAYEARLVVAKGSASFETPLGRSEGREGMQISSRMGAAPDPAQAALDVPGQFKWARAPLSDSANPLKQPG